jgi:hypothetical protein
MSGLRCLRLAGAVRAMQIALDGGGFEPGMTETRDQSRFMTPEEER